MEDLEQQSEFNSSIEYLRAIRWLMNSYHIARIDTTTVDDDLKILEELYMELEPRMDDKTLLIVESHRADARKNKNDKTILEYFRVLNRFAHRDGLIMTNKDTRLGIVKDDR